jgi:gliding motility-associated protein GldM
MYLVLTALLALNVSSEILNAFKTVDTSLQNASKIVDGKSTGLLKSLEELEKDAKTKEKAAIWNPIAKNAKQLADALVKEIEELKVELKKEAGLKMVDGKEAYKEDDLEAATRLFAEKPPIGKDKGPELKAKIEGIKAKFLALNPEIGTALANSLPIDMSTPNNKDWSETYFHMTPTVAALTILSKFQNDIQNSAAQVIELCHSKVGEVKIVFDNYVPIYGTNATYLMPNDELKITAGIGAYSKAASTTRISIDGAAATPLPDGTYEYKTTVSSSGEKKLHIEYFNQATGKQETKDVPIKYTVGSPTGITASATKVNVLYRDLENPLQISGGGKGAELINATIDNGTIEKAAAGGGLYNVKPGNGNKAVVNVVVDGKSTPFTFPVKRIPDPTPKVGASGGGSTSAVSFKAQAGIRADMGDFVFEGVKFTVSKYTIICNGKGFENTGPKYKTVEGAYFDEDVKSFIAMCKAGSSVTIQDIYVDGPGGRRKLEASMGFSLQN